VASPLNILRYAGKPSRRYRAYDHRFRSGR
jgi:hypothetical protein